MTSLLSTLTGDIEIRSLLSDAEQLAMLAVERWRWQWEAGDQPAEAVIAALGNFTPDYGFFSRPAWFAMVLWCRCWLRSYALLQTTSALLQGAASRTSSIRR